MPAQKPFTTEEAAEYCGMTYENFKHRIKTGQIVSDFRAGNSNLWFKATLDKFLAKGISKPGRPKLPGSKPRNRKPKTTAA